MLDDATRAQLAAYLQKLQTPVDLTANLDDSDTATKMRGLLDDIAAASNKVRLSELSDPAQRAPSFTVARAGTSMGVRFSGLPMGHEFTSLILALLQAGGHPPKVDDATLQRIRAIDTPLHFQTFVSLSCQNCPDVVQALNLMAIQNPKITHEMIEGGAFQQEVEQRKILSVPTVLLNDQPFGQGRMELGQILDRIDTEGAQRAAASLGERAPYDVLVVGGGPAGAAAAIYAARKGIRTGVLAERFGGQVLDTMAIENFVSVSHTEGPQLAAHLEQHVRDYEVDLINHQQAAALHTAADDEGRIGIELASGAVLRARTVVLATGARWRQLGVPGEAEFRNRGVTYCPHCDGPLFKGKRVAVIGGGNSGVEAAIDLAGVTAHVTLIEFDTALRADAVLQRKLHSLPNVDVILSAQTTQLEGDDASLTTLHYRSRSDDQLHTLPVSGVFVQIGLLPNTEWLRDGPVRLSGRGEIEIDAHGATSVPGVFAAGDATTVPFKQIVIAMGAGSTAALSAFDHLIRSTAPAERTSAGADAGARDATAGAGADAAAGAAVKAA